MKKILLLSSFIVLVALVPNCFAGANKKPNVVIILADDQTWHDAGCYGNKDIHTPNIDRLAQQGMRFVYAFTGTAMCAPSRQQLYTGLFPVKNGAYPNHSRVYKGTRSIVHYLRDLGYRVGLVGKRHFGPRDSFPFEFHKKGKMKEFMTRDFKQPFCLVYCSNSPHLPWKAGDPSRYNPQKLKLPPYFVDTPETRVSLSKYYAEITDFDREVGEMMKLLKKTGLDDNTILIYTSEQGAQFPRCKWTCYDTGLRVAMIIRWPGHVQPGSTTNALVQYVDVVPTLIDIAGGKVPAKLNGKSFRPVLLGKTDRHRKYVYGVQTTQGIIQGSKNYPIRSIRSEKYHYIWNLNHKAPFKNILMAGRDSGGYWHSWVAKAKTDKNAARFVNGYKMRPEVEFYDVLNDPYELNNLANDRKYADIRDEMRKQLVAWMEEQGDQGIETELKANSRQGKGKR